MRILSWNINGVRTLPQYHPWNTLPTFNDVLDALEADILCFQEVKSSRPALLKEVAVPPSYHAFFSFPIRKAGYSGVSTYVRKAVTVPVKAEEGLCGMIQPKPPLDATERISKAGGYPQSIIAREDDSDADDDTALDYKDLDSEGRTLVLDFGLFVLINVYCPNDGNGTEERDKFKMDFHRILEARVKGLVELEGREVIVVGDLNACAAIIDHCEGHLMVAKGLAEGLQGEEGFWGKDARRWLKGWMVADDDGVGGPMIDVTRKLWPERKGMYTCWNTKISARDSNYGTRIDYILITRGLLPWVKAADIQPHIKGSDHCPVYLDLHDEIVEPNGVITKLRDAIGMSSTPPQEPPRLASKFWDEYSGKQRLLQQFFNKPAAASSPTNTTPNPPDSKSSVVPVAGDDNSPQPLSREAVVKALVIDNIPQASSVTEDDTTPTPTPTSSFSMPTTPRFKDGPSQPLPAGTKRKLTTDTLSRNVTKKTKQIKDKEREKKSGPGQATLSSFFVKPKAKTSPGTSSEMQTPTSSFKNTSYQELDLPEDIEIVEVDSDADHHLAMPSSSQGTGSLPPSTADATEAKQAWSSLLAPIPPPNCTAHGEPSKELTVNKPGPNKGKRFFICSRPVGPGYDKGRGERLREHVDPQWKCDFFKWSTDARRELKKKDPLVHT